MNQLLSTLRLSAILFAMIGTAAHATTPGTITPEQDDTIQQDQNGDDGFIDEEQQDDGFQNEEGQDEIDSYGDEQDQDDNWGGDQGDDQNDRGQDDGYDRGQDDGYDRGQDDGYDRGQGGKNQDGKGYDRPGKPGRDYGKPRYDRRPRRLVKTIQIPYQQQFINGGTRVSLEALVNDLRRYQGYRLVNVIINGSSDMGAGAVVFCGSRCTDLQNVGYYRTAYRIQTTGERISPRSAQWFLELRGNFWIGSIQFVFVR